MSVAAIEEPPAVSTSAEPPPLPLTGDDETDEALALMRQTTGAIHEAQDRVAELSAERKRLVLSLRRRRVLFRHIAQAANSTEQTILKIHREAKRDEAHEAGDHSRCSAANCEVILREERHDAGEHFLCSAADCEVVAAAEETERLAVEEAERVAAEEEERLNSEERLADERALVEEATEEPGGS